MDETNQLSAASVFWAVAAIALNTMALPSGSVLGISGEWTFIYRASPFFCLLGTLDTCFRLCNYSLQKRSPREGMRVLLEHRFQDTQVDRTRRRTPHRETLFAVMLFLLGGLTQPIKIFTTRNILVTHLACAAYLANYFVEAFIVMLAPMTASPESNSQLGQPARVNVDRDASHDVHLAPINWMLGSNLLCALALVCRETEMNFHDTRALLIITMLVTIVVIGGVLNVQPKQQSSTNVFLHGCQIVFFGFVLAGGICLFSLPDLHKVNSNGQKLFMALAVSFAMLWGSIMFGYEGVASASFSRESDLVPRHEQMHISNCAGASWFLMFHGMLLISCYVYFYDPSTTHRPSWTTYLG